MAEKAQKPQPYDLVLSGRKIHFWKGGTGPGLLLIHSAWGDAEMSWSAVWDRLAETFTVIAADLPGFGRSSPLSRPTLQAMAQSLKELLDALNIERVIVAGNSFGAAVALQFSVDLPETATQLIVVDGGYMPVLPGIVRKIIEWPPVNRVFRRIMFYSAFSPQALKKSFVDPSRLPPDFLATIGKNASIYSPVVFDTFMSITGPLPKPNIPVFLIWGKQDGLTPTSQAKALQKRLAGALLISIDGAGHMPQVEQPKKFVMALMSVSKNAG